MSSLELYAEAQALLTRFALLKVHGPEVDQLEQQVANWRLNCTDDQFLLANRPQLVSKQFKGRHTLFTEQGQELACLEPVSWFENIDAYFDEATGGLEDLEPSTMDAVRKDVRTDEPFWLDLQDDIRDKMHNAIETYQQLYKIVKSHETEYGFTILPLENDYETLYIVMAEYGYLSIALTLEDIHVGATVYFHGHSSLDTVDNLEIPLESKVRDWLELAFKSEKSVVTVLHESPPSAPVNTPVKPSIANDSHITTPIVNDCAQLIHTPKVPIAITYAQQVPTPAGPELSIDDFSATLPMDISGITLDTPEKPASPVELAKPQISVLSMRRRT